MADIEIAKYLIGDLAETIKTFANDGSQQMIEIIGPAAISVLTIYVILWGAGIASGRINQTFGDGAYRILRICVIVLFALTASNYSEYVTDFFLTAPSEIAAKMAGAAEGTGIADVIDACLQRGFELGNRVWDYAASKFGLFHFGYIVYFFLAIVIYISVCVIVAVATGMIFVAYVATAVLLAVGPLFILLAIFQQTQRFFELWLGQLVNYAVLFILVATTVTLCFAVFEKFVGDLPVLNPGQAIIGMFKVVAGTIAIVAVLLQTQGISSALGGGVALAAQNVTSRVLGSVQSAAGTAKRMVTGGGGASASASAGRALTGGAGGSGSPRAGAAAIGAPRARMIAHKGEDKRG
jgi:type IV secretion system protein VirB6